MKNNADHIPIMKKEEELDTILKSFESAVIAFSGGVDSSFLLYKAVKVVGTENIIAVTADSLLYPKEELDSARQIASGLRVKHIIINTDELSKEEFVDNPPERCYYCKKAFLHKIELIARDIRYNTIMDGSNKEDESDFRPGSRAAVEFGVVSPLKEAFLKKEDIRLLSRQYGLTTWDKPSAACLASRFPYGERLDCDKIKRVDQAERVLRQMGFLKDLRVRSHGEMARIEVGPDEMYLLLQKRADVTEKLKNLGFLYITMDMYGFASGSMNRVLGK